MTKKLLAVLLILALLCTSACGAASNEKTASTETPAAQTQEQTPSPAQSEPAESSEPTEPAELAEPSETPAEEPDAPQEGRMTKIPHVYASKEEGAELMLSNEEYYAGFSQNDLDYKMQKVGATMEEYRAFAREQVMDFTPEEKAMIDDIFSGMEETLVRGGYSLPYVDTITIVKTTMLEEAGAGGYTHGTQIYADASILAGGVSGDEFYLSYLSFFFWHELFHCLTRANRDFQREMYAIIHFTIQEEDFPLPVSVFEYHISNPDVEHHNSYASFLIDGKMIDCFTDFVTTKHFENPGETFFSFSTTALVPIDGTDTYYTPDQAANFDEVFGTNTGYVIDPEECMADNFSYALCYGMNGPDGTGYPNPEIIEAILAYLAR